MEAREFRESEKLRSLADALRETRLIRNFNDDSFWLSVMRFFVANPFLDLTHVNPIIDFIWNQRFEPQIVFVDRSVAEERPPVQPNFSMRGRTVHALLEAVNAWHRRLGHATSVANLQWQKSEIEDFVLQEGHEESPNGRTWRIRELVCSAELTAEGKQLGHCVSSYAGSCHRGTCSIWAMDVTTEAGTEKCLTIEVGRPQNEIRQARGRFNRRPSDDERRVLGVWAAQCGLTLADYV